MRSEINSCIDELMHWAKMVLLIESSPKPKEPLPKSAVAPKNRCYKCHAPTFTAQAGCCESCRKIDEGLARLLALKEVKK